MSNVTLDLQPIVAALAALLVALTPLLTAYMARRVNQLGHLVDGQHTELLEQIATLHRTVSQQAAARLSDAKAAPAVRTPRPGDSLE